MLLLWLNMLIKIILKCIVRMTDSWKLLALVCIIKLMFNNKLCFKILNCLKNLFWVVYLDKTAATCSNLKYSSQPDMMQLEDQWQLSCGTTEPCTRWFVLVFAAFFVAIFCRGPDFVLMFLLVIIIHQIIYANKFQFLDSFFCALLHEIWCHSLSHIFVFVVWVGTWHCYKK